MEVLPDTDMLLRKMGVMALGAIGSDASSFVPALTEVLMQDAESSIRGLAVVALGQISAQEAMRAGESSTDK